MVSTVRIPLLDLGIAIGLVVIESASRGSAAPINVADGKALIRFVDALTKLDAHAIKTAWSKLTIWQRLLIAECARRSERADALAAVVGELPVPGEHLPKPKARPKPMF
jgi:hypothetical protein